MSPLIRRLVVVPVMALVMAIGLVALAPGAHAEGYRTQKNCGASHHADATVSMNAFAGHAVHVAETICTDGTNVKWATNPHVYFTSRFNPFALCESVSLGTAPFIVKKGPVIAPSKDPLWITWRFTVKQSVCKVVGTQEFSFDVTAYPARLQLNFGKASSYALFVFE